MKILGCVLQPFKRVGAHGLLMHSERLYTSAGHRDVRLDTQVDRARLLEGPAIAQDKL